MSDFLKKSRFFFTFLKNHQISNFMKIRRVAAELFNAEGRAGGRTDRHYEANSRFSQYCERAQQTIRKYKRNIKKTL